VVLSFLVKVCWVSEGATSAEKIGQAIRDGLKLSAKGGSHGCV
jgi:hypothetical protein